MALITSRCLLPLPSLWESLAGIALLCSIQVVHMVLVAAVTRLRPQLYLEWRELFATGVSLGQIICIRIMGRWGRASDEG